MFRPCWKTILGALILGACLVGPAPAGSESAPTGRQYQAQWIWANVASPKPFQFARFRKTVELASRPERATAYVTADTFYRLWINGQLAMHGPARSSRGKATVDAVPVGRHLAQGRNTLMIEVFHGVCPFEALAQAPGLLCELEAEFGGRKTILAATDAAWEASEIMAWSRQSLKFNYQRGWTEQFDARRIGEEKPQPAIVLGKVGTAPWRNVEMRDVPLPAPLVEIRPVSVVAVQRGDGYAAEFHGPETRIEPKAEWDERSAWFRRLHTEHLAADPTAATNTLDAYMDCPHRERNAMYGVEGYWMLKAVYPMFGDTSVSRRSIRFAAESVDDPAGRVRPLVSIAYPMHLEYFNTVIPTQPLFWILHAGLYERCSGDAELIRDVLLRNEQQALVPSSEASETTQYFVLWGGVPSPQRQERMWQALRDDFLPTPRRKVQPIRGLTRAGLYPFPQRLEVAARLGDHAALVRDAKAMFLPMVDNPPGTLWEDPMAGIALCHSIACGVGGILTEEVLGIRLGFPLKISPHNGGTLQSCRGFVTTPKGRVQVAKTVWQSAPATRAWPAILTVRRSATIVVAPGKVETH